MPSAREQILTAAEECFKRKGIQEVSVQDICERAGVSRTSFYREFRGSDDVVATLAIRLWTQRLSQSVKRVDNVKPALERWRKFIRESVREARERPLFYAARNEESVIHIIRLMYRDNGAYLHELINVLRPFIERSQQEGAIRTDQSVEVIVDWVARQMWSLTSVPYAGPKSDDAQIDLFVDQFVLPSIMPPRRDASTDVLTKLDEVTARLSRIESGLGTRPRK